MKYNFEDLKKRLETETDIESKCSAISRYFYPVPVRITFESWSSEFEIRISTVRKTTCLGPTRWLVNADDMETLEKLYNYFKYIDHTMVGILGKVCFEQKLHGMKLFCEEEDIDEMLKRWDKFTKYMLKHFPEYAETSTCDRGFHWDEKKGENVIAWAARCILGGIKPSRVGIDAVKAKTAQIDESGLLTFTEKSGLKSRWHFVEGGSDGERHITALDCFGISGSIGCAMQKAFGNDKDIVETNKVPEQWEIDAGVFIGIKAPKKGIFK